MVEIRKPIFVREAIERCMNYVKRNNKEKVRLNEATGRTLADAIIATHDVPHFNRSPYDGFAIRAIDSKGASGENRIAYRVIDAIGAGQVSQKRLNANEAVRIMTGAPLPEGADAIVMLEQTRESDMGFKIRKPFESGENVSFRGEDIKQGETLIEAGTTITPGIVAVLATFGYSDVTVYRKPKVGLLTTGTELLAVEEKIVHGKIRDSNGPMIASQLQQLGIDCQVFRATADDLPTLIQKVEEALEEVDCLITTGGVSVGDYDYLPAVYEHIGATVLFNKVGMRPGSVTTVAVKGHQYLFGLSGNPSACYTGFELFVRPVILSMIGNQKPYLQHSQAILGEDFTKANPFTRFIRATYTYSENGPIVTPAGFNKSNAVSSIARSNALIVLPGGTKGYRKGDQVDVLHTDRRDGARQWML